VSAPQRLLAKVRCTTNGSVFVAVTEGVRVVVQAHYLPEQSNPSARRFVFAYTIRISNESVATVKLVSRHWLIQHGNGKREEVRGPGVVGEQPVIAPGGGYQYTSGCILTTPHGTMEGTYEMVRDDGSTFRARIPAFSLATPHVLN
jgi:ApaG protein